MIYPIYIYGSQVLRNESEEVTKDYPELKKLVANMFETTYSSDGVGLAAPQIGKNIRLFVVDTDPMIDPEEDDEKPIKQVFINPEIYEESEEEELFNEGCLSLPGMHEEVSRPVAIKIRYMDENFVEHDSEFGGYAARVIQHEYDHLDGVVFTDHLTALRKTLIKNKLTAMSKGKYKASYKTKLTK